MTDYIGLHEIAARCGVTRQMAFKMAGRRSFPSPVAHLAMGRVWRAQDVKKWVEERGRTW